MFELYKKNEDSFILIDYFQTIEECHSKAISEDIKYYSIENRFNGLSSIVFMSQVVKTETTEE